MDYSYWGVKESPFRFGLDPKGFFLSGVHEEALARLEFLVQHQRHLGLLVGAAGLGKSLLLEVFSHKMRRAGCRVAQICAAGASRHEWLWDILGSLGRSAKPETSLSLLWPEVFDRFREAYFMRTPVVLLCDQMESAAEEGRQVLARLLGYGSRPGWLLSVVLSGRPEMVGQLDSGLLERVDLRMELEPWDFSETERYLIESLARAGRTEPVFTPEAMSRLHELSGGIPRRVAQLADWSLLAGAVQGVTRIDAEIVEAVDHELSRARPKTENVHALSPSP